MPETTQKQQREAAEAARKEVADAEAKAMEGVEPKKETTKSPNPVSGSTIAGSPQGFQHAPKPATTGQQPAQVAPKPATPGPVPNPNPTPAAAPKL